MNVARTATKKVVVSPFAKQQQQRSQQQGTSSTRGPCSLPVARAGTRKGKGDLRTSTLRNKHTTTLTLAASTMEANMQTKQQNQNSTQKLSKDLAKDLLGSAKAFIFDCDGVIWRGDKLIEGIPETIAALRAAGKKMIFVTNNSTKSRAGYLKKFTSLGLNIEAEEVYSSSYAAAAYLKSKNFPQDGSQKVYVVGEVGIMEELELAGIPHFGGPQDSDSKITLGAGVKMAHDAKVSAVIVGFDREINYYKIQYATLCIRENEGCEFIATNRDAVTHLTDAQEWAGNGSMVGAIAGSAAREPYTVGKPSTFMLDDIANKFNIDKSEICMVGDRLDTDIMFGQNGGLKTMLVLSGVTREETLLSEENGIHPDLYAPSIAEMLPALKEMSS
jgi:phosphoglycolate/pyridoxal phosphate phosphatase family enzyme